MPAAGSHSSKALRRTHRKSRTGCAFCKRRKIKCDERKPACDNCARRSIPCEYVDGVSIQSRGDIETANGCNRGVYDDGIQLPSPSPSTLAEQTRSRAPDAQEKDILFTQSLPQSPALDQSTLNITDLELLHAWQNSTAPSISAFISKIDTALAFWQVIVPEIGFTYPYVLHAVLALSAIHLARFKRDRKQFYKNASQRHWNQGFSMATSQMTQVSNEDYHALFAFSQLSCMYKFAKGPAPGDYLAFSEEGHEPPEWLVYYRGFHSFMILGIDAMRSGPFADLIEVASQKTRQFFAPTDAPDPKPIAELRRMCKDILENDSAKHVVYTAAVGNLSRCFSIMLRGTNNGEFNILVWSLNIPQDFIPYIQEREPMALVIFAFFVALLNELSAWWVLDGWVKHLMSGIWDALPVWKRSNIRWPMEQIGWIPP